MVFNPTPQLPNTLGFTFGMAQMILYAIYRNANPVGDPSKLPLQQQKSDIVMSSAVDHPPSNSPPHQHQHQHQSQGGEAHAHAHAHASSTSPPICNNNNNNNDKYYCMEGIDIQAPPAAPVLKCEA